MPDNDEEQVRENLQKKKKNDISEKWRSIQTGASVWLREVQMGLGSRIQIAHECILSYWPRTRGSWNVTCWHAHYPLAVGVSTAVACAWSMPQKSVFVF